MAVIKLNLREHFFRQNNIYMTIIFLIILNYDYNNSEENNIIFNHSEPQTAHIAMLKTIKNAILVRMV